LVAVKIRLETLFTKREANHADTRRIVECIVSAAVLEVALLNNKAFEQIKKENP
jgi:hypothetical protein